MSVAVADEAHHLDQPRHDVGLAAVLAACAGPGGATSRLGREHLADQLVDRLGRERIILPRAARRAARARAPAEASAHGGCARHGLPSAGSTLGEPSTSRGADQVTWREPRELARRRRDFGQNAAVRARSRARMCPRGRRRCCPASPWSWAARARARAAMAERLVLASGLEPVYRRDRRGARRRDGGADRGAPGAARAGVADRRGAARPGRRAASAKPPQAAPCWSTA